MMVGNEKPGIPWRDRDIRRLRRDIETLKTDPAMLPVHTHATAVQGGPVAHTVLTSIGTNTHAQIDTHIAATAAHGATATPTAARIPIAGAGATLHKDWYPDFVASGASHAKGAVPDPGVSAGISAYLREDATWVSPWDVIPLYSVDDYGAVGDGTTDDTTAFQNALTAGAVNGGIVWVPPRVFIVQALTVAANVVLQGCGFDSVVKRKTGAGSGTYCLTLTGGSGVGHNGVVNLTVDGNKAANGNNGGGIKVAGSYRAKIEGVRVTSCGEYGIYAHDDGAGNAARELLISHVFSESNNSDGIRIDYNAWDTAFRTVECGSNGGSGLTLSMAGGTRMFTVACWYNAACGVNIYHGERIFGSSIRCERNAQDGLYIESGRQIVLFEVSAYYNSSSNFVGTGKNTYSGVRVAGADTFNGITGSKWLVIVGRSGDDLNAEYTNLPYQKYGVEEAAGGTFANCTYMFNLANNATGKSTMVAGTMWDLESPPAPPTALCATTANHALSGLTAIDGVTPTAGCTVVVWKQTTASQNGLYTASSGAWLKTRDFDIATPLSVAVCQGTANGRLSFVVTADDTVLPLTGVWVT